MQQTGIGPILIALVALLSAIPTLVRAQNDAMNSGSEAAAVTEPVSAEQDDQEKIRERREMEASMNEDPEAQRRARAGDPDQDEADDEPLTEEQVEVAEIEARREDEASLNEDPEAQRRARAQAAEAVAEAAVEAGEPPPEPPPVTSLEIYGSARVHAINTFDLQTGEHKSKVGDGNSRVGARGDWQFKPGWYLYGRAEFGIDVTQSYSSRGELFGDGGFQARLAFIGIDHDNLNIIYGKNWSTYYQVAGITDRFAIFGGSASGVYNATTAGQATGTGRADDVLQARIYIETNNSFFEKVKPFNLHLQYQEGQAIPLVTGEKYRYSWGASALLETEKEFTFGIAYNRAEVPIERMAVQTAGIDGDAAALAVATRAYGARWYAGLVISVLDNMEVTNEGRYFNAVGVELYTQWEARPNWWLIAGFNWLDPDTEDPDVGEFRTRYAVIGGRYAFDSFKRMLYVEYKLDDGRLSDGAPLKNEITIGVRWDFGT